MNNDQPRADGHANTNTAPNRSFGAEAQQETEHVFRRGGGESLDDYLKNVNAYLDDLNRRCGAPPTPPATGADVPFSAAPEQSVPYGAAPQQGIPYNAAPQQGVPYGPSPEQGVPYNAAPQQGVPYGPSPEQGVPYNAAPQQGVPYVAAPYQGAPYGAFTGASIYTESVNNKPRYNGGDWQTAVPHPELYPDLDDPGVVATKGSRKKRKKKSRKKDAVSAGRGDARGREPRSEVPTGQNGPGADGREKETAAGKKSRFSFVTTWINLALYGGWVILYFVCLTVRSVMFTSTQAEMAAQGVGSYSVTISSPLFILLKLMIYAMPIVLLLWMAGVLKADKRGLQQVNKKLLIAALAADLAAGIIVIFDAAAAGLVFGA